jgi:hypothetical protein
MFAQIRYYQCISCMQPPTITHLRRDHNVYSAPLREAKVEVVGKSSRWFYVGIEQSRVGGLKSVSGRTLAGTCGPDDEDRDCIVRTMRCTYSRILLHWVT